MRLPEPEEVQRLQDMPARGGERMDEAFKKCVALDAELDGLAAKYKRIIASRIAVASTRSASPPIPAIPYSDRRLGRYITAGNMFMGTSPRFRSCPSGAGENLGLYDTLSAHSRRTPT